MTSVERDSSGVYGQVEKPSYSILTYTWGRWKVRSQTQQDQPAIPIKGTNWKMPVVKKEHFTVAQFQAVLDRMRDGGSDWAWVDIACIDQEDEELNAQEVGRQASIFKKARNVYVWLSGLSTDVLQKVINEISKTGPHLTNHLMEHLPGLPYVHLNRLYTAFDILFSDPWFSSLWTLQEVIMRHDAKVLSSSAESVRWDEDHSTFLSMVINACRNIYGDLDHLREALSTVERDNGHLSPDEERVRDEVTQLSKHILRAGFNFFLGTNPNIQYGIAKYRRTSREVDRIYAIMQIYNLRVGKSARPGDSPALPSLINEFALAIITQCPVIGQSFIHTTPPARGLSWRITENSTVPHFLRTFNNMRPQCSVVCDSFSNNLRITGKVCLLHLLGRPKNPFTGIDSSGITVAADAMRRKTVHPMGKSAHDTSGLSDYLQLQIEYGRDIWVLLLGKGDTWTGTVTYGLLVYPGEKESGEWLLGKDPCKRVGVCSVRPMTRIIPWRQATILLE
ncbi:heterokaryon incompatibility protein-domain-containing protein [Penicillium concentricum]|uniref:Heterokaryon incompatibility protein-domain-containing protein n=1 Tax=Penicillium concentricum TaxID=293559 RepID=A0A9W9S4H8_9EURO|nr:heterokaryon incompatibility protein-domain-containing protein [Penicillium concentricum]KAJ5371866.1 heterokaryon incompatibility protein-domain-containing protein [Penicillium concentricum]